MDLHRKDLTHIEVDPPIVLREVNLSNFYVNVPSRTIEGTMYQEVELFTADFIISEITLYKGRPVTFEGIVFNGKILPVEFGVRIPKIVRSTVSNYIWRLRIKRRTES